MNNWLSIEPMQDILNHTSRFNGGKGRFSVGWLSLSRGLMVHRSVFGQRDHLVVASENWTQPEQPGK